MSELKPFMVLYRNKNEILIDPWGFRCMAEDLVHAEEQFFDSERGTDPVWQPDVEILWVVQTDDYYEAVENYYMNGE